MVKIRYSIDIMLNGRQYAMAHAYALYRGTVTNRPLQLRVNHVKS